MNRWVIAADIGHKVIGLGLIGFTVIGSLNVLSMFHYKHRRNVKAQEILDQETPVQIQE
jgi:hypothetical protein